MSDTEKSQPLEKSLTLDSDATSTGIPEKRPLSSYIWDTWNKSPEERRFLAKLDACLLTYAALSYFSK
ncbi:hypothetical protein EUX98_g4710 [Antrodiella citrinella]|uniref:Uncharacterized protein n=1 Tax=Antrodiella citrinella TaxID=2447956 RepID=A0A4S4MV56_9APHY|nr:hypothetical protein EUX98_g4710 [Antrodiella citrinella]